MKPFSLWLSEARKNPEDNPKITAYEALKKYKDDPDIYISFTEVDKIGINPQSAFASTPLAIYTLPLAKAWKYYRVDSQQSIQKTINIFCSHAPYIWVLKNKHKPTFIEDMHSGYTSANYDKDVVKLKKIYMDAYADKKEKEVLKHKDAFPESIEKWEKAFDTSLDKKWKELVKSALNTAYPRNPIKCFWEISMSLAITLASSSKSTIVQWNKILRQCGYSGFCDTGNGYIHQSEPIQAIFLSTDAFEVVEKVYNKEYDKLTFIKKFSDIIKLIHENPKSIFYITSEIAGHHLPAATKYYGSKKDDIPILCKYASQDEWIEFLKGVNKYLKTSPPEGIVIMEYLNKVIVKNKLQNLADYVWES